jgi:hypothetical protein
MLANLAAAIIAPLPDAAPKPQQEIVAPVLAPLQGPTQSGATLDTVRE